MPGGMNVLSSRAKRPRRCGERPGRRDPKRRYSRKWLNDDKTPEAQTVLRFPRPPSRVSPVREREYDRLMLLLLDGPLPEQRLAIQSALVDLCTDEPLRGAV